MLRCINSKVTVPSMLLWHPRMWTINSRFLQFASMKDLKRLRIDSRKKVCHILQPLALESVCKYKPHTHACCHSCGQDTDELELDMSKFWAGDDKSTRPSLGNVLFCVFATIFLGKLFWFPNCICALKTQTKHLLKKDTNFWTYYSFLIRL